MRLRLGPDLVEREDQGGAANGQATAAAGAIAVGRVAGIAMVDDHLVEIGPDVVGRELGEGRLLPLPVRRDTGEDRHFAPRLDPHGGAFPGSKPTDLDVGGEANAEVAPLLAQLVLLLPQPLIVDQLQRPVERLLVLASVVLLAGERGVRELVRGDEVDPPHLGRVETSPRRR